MTTFDESHWAEADFVQGYREGADFYILERRRMLEILKSFYRYFMNGRRGVSVLDLGCGDGIMAHELLSVDGSISVTLVDASEDMLGKAKERLKDHKDSRFIQSSFQELIRKDPVKQNFDVIVSSLAIHHLTIGEKTALFEYGYSHLNAGGRLLIFDIVLAPAESLEGWYLSLWKEWIEERKSIPGMEDTHYEDIVQFHKDNPDDKPDTLQDQINALKSIGFADVDCYYKYGIFAMFGGRK